MLDRLCAWLQLGLFRAAEAS